MSKDKNPSAFPTPKECYESRAGMTLRDYFAARCPEKHIGTHNWGDIKKFKKLSENADIREWKDEYSLEYNCAKRYAYADAMLKARQKE